MSKLLRTIRAKLIFAMGALAVAAAGLASYGIYEVNSFNDRINFVTQTVGNRIVFVSHANEAFVDYYGFR